MSSELQLDSEKRDKMPPVPSPLEDYLNEDQMLSLRKVENFGWTLKFVRRPVFQEPVPVVMGPGGQPMGVIEKDGHINQDFDLVIRD